MVAAVRAAGRPAWHLIGQNEGHGFAKKENQDYQFWVSLMFWQQHLLGERTGGGNEAMAVIDRSTAPSRRSMLKRRGASSARLFADRVPAAPTAATKTWAKAPWSGTTSPTGSMPGTTGRFYLFTAIDHRGVHGVQDRRTGDEAFGVRQGQRICSGSASCVVIGVSPSLYRRRCSTTLPICSLDPACPRRADVSPLPEYPARGRDGSSGPTRATPPAGAGGLMDRMAIATRPARRAWALAAALGEQRWSLPAAALLALPAIASLTRRRVWRLRWGWVQLVPASARGDRARCVWLYLANANARALGRDRPDGLARASPVAWFFIPLANPVHALSRRCATPVAGERQRRATGRRRARPRR